MSNNTNLRLSLEEDTRALMASVAVIYAFKLAPTLIAVLASVSVIYWYSLTSRMFSRTVDEGIQKTDQYVSSIIPDKKIKTIRPVLYLSIALTISFLALI